MKEISNSHLSHGLITPVRVKVDKLLSSRYKNGDKPLSWDLRKSGVDVVQTTDGHTVKLLSDGGQSPPKSGWSIVLERGDEEKGYGWTLYGMQ